MSTTSRPRVLIGSTALPAVPPWDANITITEPIDLQVGDVVRVRLSWLGSNKGYEVVLEKRSRTALSSDPP